MGDSAKAIVVKGRCEYAGRVIPIVCNYSNDVLVSIECPKTGCSFSHQCKLVQDAPRFLPGSADT